MSIFGTADQAAAAWRAQRSGWLSIDTHGVCGGSGALGDAGYACADSGPPANGNLLEYFFKRGRILIQVYDFNSYDDLLNNLDSVVIPTIRVGRHIAELLDATATSTPGSAVLERASGTLLGPSDNWWPVHSLQNESTSMHSSIQSRVLTRVQQMAGDNAP